MATRKKTAAKSSPAAKRKVAKPKAKAPARGDLTPKQRQTVQKIGHRLDDVERRLSKYASESGARGATPMEKRLHAAAGELARVGAQAVARLHRELEENPARNAEWRKKLSAVVGKRFEFGFRVGKKPR